MAPSGTLSRPRMSSLHLLALFALCALRPGGTARAAEPSGGTITPTGPALTWTGTAVGTGSANEATCVEGFNCDTFTLFVGGAPADYAGKVIAVNIQWSVSANDYDLYIHKASNAGLLVGVSAGGATQNSEASAIDPAATGTGIYTVHVVYFAVTPAGTDPYKGSASVQVKPTARTATYVQGGIPFSPSVRLKAPVARRDGEPSNRTDPVGNAYVSGIRGVPAGVDLWYFDLNPSSPTYDPNMRNPIYRGQPDSFTDMESTAVGGDGGGDVDIAVGLPDPGGANNNPPTLAATSLTAANISAQRSTNRGVSFMKNPAGNVTGGVPVDDRQWLAFYGPNTVYLLYRTVAPAVTQIQRSIDGGLTYGLAATAGAIGQVGAIDVDQLDGTVYVAGSTGKVCTGVPSALTGELIFRPCTQAASDPNGVAHLFFIVKKRCATPFGSEAA